MTLRMKDIEFKTAMPQLPKTLPVHALRAQTLEERRPALGRLAESLRLTDLRTVELDHGVVLAGRQGDITYFHASGAVLARDATASPGTADEMRRWDGQVDSKTGGNRIALSSDASRKLTSKTREFFQSLGLIGNEVASEAVQLDQVSRLDAKGREVEYGAGQATVKFLYAVEGTPVRGAGAKTLAFLEPGDGQPRFESVFHAWRELGKAASVKVPPLEEALGAGLLNDPELVRYHAAGHRIEVTRIEFVYLALPAFQRQSHLFPVFQVEGSVSKGRLGIPFHFGRFHHAIPPASYAAASVYGTALTVNPDGIAPAGTKENR